MSDVRPVPCYGASLEWLCDHAAVLRVHEGAGTGYGDPYVWACTVSRDGDIAFLMGAVVAPPIGAARAICRALREAGFARRSHVRRQGNTVRALVKSI